MPLNRRDFTSWTPHFFAILFIPPLNLKYSIGSLAMLYNRRAFSIHFTTLLCANGKNWRSKATNNTGVVADIRARRLQ